MKPPANLSIALLLSLACGAMARAASPADEQAGQITTRVYQNVNAGPSTGPLQSVAEFANLVSAASWSELWPDENGTDVSRFVTSGIWNNAIQATLDKYGSVYLPKSDTPYYIDNPIVLKSGQRLTADTDAEIRLRPGVSTCMVRNENIISGQRGALPAEKTDSNIVVEGGIWTTLATSATQSNGNSRGRSDQGGGVPGCHGVILMSNVSGLVARKLTVRQSMPHGLQISNCSNFLVEGITFDQHRRDGVHINGSADYGIIRNVSGDTYDDFIALNAWDWQNATPAFGQIDHILVEDIRGNPIGNGSDTIRFLPGNKDFADGSTLDCRISNCVLRDLVDIRTVKMYDQPNLEMGRNVDFSNPIGDIDNVMMSNLVFNRPGTIQVAANINGVSIDNVQLNYDIHSPSHADAKLIEVGPMSMTYKFDPNNPATWVEVFSPDKDIVVQGFHLTNVSAKVGDDLQAVSRAEASLIQVAGQKLNPDYPNTTPRGGTGKVRLVNCLVSASLLNASFEDGVGNTAPPTDWSYEGAFRACQEVAALGGLTKTASGSKVLQLNIGDNESIYVSQDLPTDYVAGNVYELTVALGMRNDLIAGPAYADSEDWTLSFNYADTGEEIARLSGTIINDAEHTGFLSDQMLRYVASDEDAGHGIQIRIHGSTAGKSGPGSVHYGLLSVDNVRIDAYAVPEPATSTLVGMIAVGLLIGAGKRLANERR